MLIMKKFDINFIAAKVISAVFNPVLLYPIVFTLVAFSKKQDFGAYLFYMFVIYFPLAIYLLWFVYVKHKGNIQLLVWNRNERNGIYLLGAYTSLFATIFFTPLAINFWIINSFLSFLIFGSFYLLNKYIDKASLHAGIYSYLVIYLANFNLLFLFLLIFLPLIYWSRIILHKHTWLQLFLGSVVGMFIGILSWMMVFKN